MNLLNFCLSSAGKEAVGADLGEGLLDGRVFPAVGDAGLELAEGPDGEQRVGVALGADQVEERDLVVQPERGVAEAFGAGVAEFGVDGADELLVGGGLVGLGAVADETLVHGCGSWCAVCSVSGTDTGAGRG